MSRGGARPGAGRKKGQKNKLTVKRAQAMKKVARELKQHNPQLFEGDAHALMMAIYKDPKLPLSIRLDAAKAASKFEKPALSSVACAMAPEPASTHPEPGDPGPEWRERIAKRFGEARRFWENAH